jgi:phosphoenolpyruvate carboxykinase (ATP)
MNLKKVSTLQLQLSHAELIEEAVLNGEGKFSNEGALVCYTGKFTGRSPLDKFIVKDSCTSNAVDWGAVNIPISEEHFESLYNKMQSYLIDKKIYVRDMYACAMPKYRIPVRVINTLAWHNLFCLNLFIQPTEDELKDFDAGFTIVCIPEFEANPSQDGTRQKNFTILNLSKRVILIGGTQYAGELKKCIFTVLNYLLPLNHNVLPMHCSATVGKNDDTAIFFGLSGTGKTTLSADPTRSLVGDDQHGWSDDSIFNFEGGCYAKTIGLSKEKEPHIYEAIRFGSLLENVVMDSRTRLVDYKDDNITENTRAAYPISFIGNAKHPSIAHTPSNIFFLACDAYGILPPISRLSKEQAIYHFLSGYTAKVAGTESGVKEPSPTFSACFGAVFLPLHPVVYATLLGKKLESTNISVWLVNTGWVGGKYGVGSRIDLPKTRAIIDAALSGKLDNVEYIKHEVFGVSIPKVCPGIPCEILNPNTNWANPSEYDNQAKELALAFVKNFSKYEDKVEVAVLKGGPKV